MPPLPSLPEVIYTRAGGEAFAEQMERFRVGEVAMLISQSIDEDLAPTHFFYPPHYDPNAVVTHAMLMDEVISMNVTTSEHFGTYFSYLAIRGLTPEQEVRLTAQACAQTEGEVRGRRLGKLFSSIPLFRRFIR